MRRLRFRDEHLRLSASLSDSHAAGDERNGLFFSRNEEAVVLHSAERYTFARLSSSQNIILIKAVKVSRAPEV